MKKIKAKKLTLNKKLIASLSTEENRKILGGWTTSFTYCTGLGCCNTGNGGTGSNGPCTFSNCVTC
jgi:hypothetical protein